MVCGSTENAAAVMDAQDGMSAKLRGRMETEMGSRLPEVIVGWGAAGAAADGWDGGL